MKAPASGIHLTEDDASIVKGMIDRGDRQHDIAAWFGVNGGRIAEISSGDTFPDVKAQTTDLPPQGPYTSGKDINETKERLSEIKTALEGLTEEIENQIKKLDS